MAEAGKVDGLYAEWRAAEARYAQALAAFGGDDPPAKVKKDSALALAAARSKADRAGDAYFKRVLK